jgi:TonB family protein
MGLGLRDDGAGGGGTSATAMGIGRVGSGSGVSKALGAGRLGAGGASDLSTSEPVSVSGGLDREVIRRVILGHRAQVRYCYEKSLASQPGLEGRVLVEFVIGADGRVTSARPAEDALGDGAVGRCLVSKVLGWTFPAPKGGGVVVVSYPFAFKPAGGRGE